MALVPRSTSETLAWVEDLGVVLQSAHGPVANAAEFVAGVPIRGSWWGHDAAKAIYAVLSALDESPDIVTTRLVNGKLTLIHSRVWPAIVCVADELGVERLGAVHQEHTTRGTHRRFDVDFPLWVPRDVQALAVQLSRDEAFRLLPDCLRVAP